jgi:transcriptional regulator with PAS, ATPase and Fis domain
MNLITAHSWADEMDVRVTVCDHKGIIVYMNKTAALSMHKYGSYDLIGKSLFDCHNPKSCSMIKEMLENPFVNSYMVEKEGKRRLIRQFPWEEEDSFKGIIEMSFPIPVDLEVKVRD